MFRRAKKRVTRSGEGNAKRETPPSESSPDIQGPLGSEVDKHGGEDVLEKLVLGGEAQVLDSLRQDSQVKSTKQRRVDCERKAAWVDEDSEDRNTKSVASKGRFSQSYSQKLKQRYESILETPFWAQPKDHSGSDSEDSDTDQLTHTTGNYLSTSVTLPQSILDIKQCTDANKESPANSKLTCVEFHPSSQVILTAGTNNTLTLFQVDGKQNPKIQSIFLDNYPIYTAHFSVDGEQVVMASKHKSFYYYDLMSGVVVNVPRIKGLEENCLKKFEVSPDGKYLVFLGKFGYIHLLSTKSKEWVHSLKMNGNVESVAFLRDGKTMLSFGDEGQVYVWDLNQRDCIHRFIDDGCLTGTALAVSPNDQYIACGSSSGVVNIYEKEKCLTSQNPRPIKAIMNLTTVCTQARFNSTSEILALSSNMTEKAVKLVHCPSMTVFSNFPNRSESALRIPLSLDFSTHSGYFSIGTHKGTALLYRLKHYRNY